MRDDTDRQERARRLWQLISEAAVLALLRQPSAYQPLLRAAARVQRRYGLSPRKRRD